MSIDFDSLLSKPTAPVSTISGWRRFGLLRNPFPHRAHPIWDVFYNQTAVRERFERELQTFLQVGSTATLLLQGGNRVGKTHLMQYYRQQLPVGLNRAGVNLPIAFLSAQGADFKQFYGQLIDQVDDSLQKQCGQGIFQQPVASNALAAMPGGDLQRALKKANERPAERDELLGLLRRWVRGDRLSAAERRLLDVRDAVDSIGPYLQVLAGLVGYLHRTPAAGALAPYPGIMILLDEFELVWKVRRDRRDQFLQNLRALIDACPKGLFLCVGMTTGLGVALTEVEATYPALYQRLRGHQQRDIPTLMEVGSVVDALGYAESYLERARREAGTETFPPKILSEDDVLSRKQVEDIFNGLRGKRNSVAQGDFFDRIYEVAAARAEQSSP